MKLYDNLAYELNRHLNDEAEAELRAETRQAMIEEAAKDLIREGQELYPLDMLNFQEAINEASLGDAFEFLSALRAYTKVSETTKPYLAVTVVNELLAMVNKYWMKQAIAVAEREY